MKFRIRFAQQIVGVFVLIAVVAVGAVVVSMASSQRWFARTYNYYSVFPTAEGLSVGMSINYKGFTIGRVTEINLEARDEVLVNFYIQDTFHERVVPNSLLQLVTSPIGLGGGLVFHQGRGQAPPLEEGSLIPAVNSKEGQQIVQQELAIMPASGDSITRIIAQVEPLLLNVNNLLLSLDTTIGHVNLALAGDQTEPLGVTIAQLGVTIDQITSLLLEVEATLVDTRAQSTEILGNIAGITGNVELITGNVEATTAELRDPTGLVPRLLDADGSITTFLNDNNVLFDHVEQMLASINASLDEVNELAAFVNSTQPQIAGILEESRAAIATGQDVLEGVSNNPLIRRGITPEIPQPSTFQSHRDAQF